MITKALEKTMITKSVLNAGFIGVGNFITGNHLPNTAASDLWNVHTVCDIDESNLDNARINFSPDKCCTDYEQLLSDPEVDVVILGVRHSDHLRFAKEIAAAGKHFFMEKPMSSTHEESLEIIDAVQDAGVQMMVGYNRRFGPLYTQAKDIFHKRNHGKQAMITFRAVDDIRMWPDWPFDLNDGGGKILCECCHFFDFLSWFLDAEPVRIFCEGYRKDENLVTIMFDDGSIGCIISGGGGSMIYPKERLEVFCDSSTLAVDHCLDAFHALNPHRQTRGQEYESRGEDHHEREDAENRDDRFPSGEAQEELHS